MKMYLVFSWYSFTKIIETFITKYNITYIFLVETTRKNNLIFEFKENYSL